MLCKPQNAAQSQVCRAAAHAVMMCAPASKLPERVRLVVAVAATVLGFQGPLQRMRAPLPSPDARCSRPPAPHAPQAVLRASVTVVQQAEGSGAPPARTAWSLTQIQGPATAMRENTPMRQRLQHCVWTATRATTVLEGSTLASKMHQANGCLPGLHVPKH